MNVDWAIAVSVFLVLVALGFAYYFDIFQARPATAADWVEPISRKVLASLQADTWKVPVRYSSQDAGLGVFYFDFIWPPGTENSTRIMDSGLELSCMLEGGRVYFEASVEQGDNDFQMTFTDEGGPPECDSLLDTSGANRSIAWAAEKSLAVSQSRIDLMLGTEYNQFRQSLGITRNFRVEMDSGTTISYGPAPPSRTSTYVRETRSLIRETGQPVAVRVLVW